MPSEVIPTARIPRPLQVALFALAMIWFFASEAIAAKATRGLAGRFDLNDSAMLLEALLLLFLLLTGFAMLHWIVTRQGSVGRTLGLPRRSGWTREWALGAAIGWALVVATVLPMALLGKLRPHLWGQPRSLWLTVLALATLAVGTLAQEVVFRGYPFRRLIDGIGPTAATLLLAVVFTVWSPLTPEAPILSIVVTMLFSILLSMAYLRTHALWLPWGLHFAWSASMGVLFGLPVQGMTQFSTVVETRAVGPLWLTGGSYGPAAALLAVPVLLVGMVVLYRTTREYAWQYTHPPIIAAGYPMDVAPPAAHEAMEREAKPPALVQILPTTPHSGGVNPPNVEGRRSE